MEIEQIQELEAVGLPFRFHFLLRRSHKDQVLHHFALPDFLAHWVYHESVQRQANGDKTLLYIEYVNMQACLADIGATVSSTSDAEPYELMRHLSNITLPSSEHLELQWEDAIEGADEVVSRYEDSEFDSPRSLHLFKSSLALLEAPILYPELEEVETVSDIATTTISFELIEDDWPVAARRAFNVGIAFPSRHPDFYYATEKHDSLSKSNGHNPHKTEDYITSLKRRFHLAQCHIWARVCRPDLAHMLDNR